MGTILMYIVNSENEIPSTLTNNTAYYIVGKEVRIVDNAGGINIFKIENKKDEKDIETRLSSCEGAIERIVKHLTSFKEV